MCALSQMDELCEDEGMRRFTVLQEMPHTITHHHPVYVSSGV